MLLLLQSFANVGQTSLLLLQFALQLLVLHSLQIDVILLARALSLQFLDLINSLLKLVLCLLETILGVHVQLPQILHLLDFVAQIIL